MQELGKHEERTIRILIDAMIERINDDPRTYMPPDEPGYIESLMNGECRLITQEECEEGVVAMEEAEKTHILITPAVDEGWIVETCQGGVDRKRIPMDISDLPAHPRGEFYATWIAERAGLYYAPWIIWDVDDADLNNALLRTQKLVARLQGFGAHSGNLRVVFSTNKGFHVYLDSRTIGLKPSKNLHAELKAFCAKLATTDASLYSLRRVIGVPNSKHRKTGWLYSLVPLEVLEKGWLAEIKMLTAKPQEIPARVDAIEAIPALSALFTPIHRGLSSAHVAEIVSEPPPEFKGVKEGDRDAAAYHLAMYYRRQCPNLTQTEVLVLCLHANTRNQPPLPEGVIKEKVWRAFQTKTTAQ